MKSWLDELSAAWEIPPDGNDHDKATQAILAAIEKLQRRLYELAGSAHPDWEKETGMVGTVFVPSDHAREVLERERPAAG
jgi:hypothetical protein